MVSGYVPPGGDKRKLIQESHAHIWDEPYLFEYAMMAYLGDVYL
jgi:hypothetical protein